MSGNTGPSHPVNPAAATAHAAANAGADNAAALAAEHVRESGGGNQNETQALLEKYLGQGYSTKYDRIEHALKFTPNKLAFVVNPTSSALKEGLRILHGKTQEEKSKAQKILKEIEEFKQAQAQAKETLEKANATATEKEGAKETLAKKRPHSESDEKEAQSVLKAQTVTEDQRIKTGEYLRDLVDTKGIRNHEKWFDVFLKPQMLTNPAAVLLGGILRLMFTAAWPARRANNILNKIKNLAQQGAKLTTEQIENEVKNIEADIHRDNPNAGPARPINLLANLAAAGVDPSADIGSLDPNYAASADGEANASESENGEAETKATPAEERAAAAEGLSLMAPKPGPTADPNAAASPDDQVSGPPFFNPEPPEVTSERVANPNPNGPRPKPTRGRGVEGGIELRAPQPPSV